MRPAIENSDIESLSQYGGGCRRGPREVRASRSLSRVLWTLVLVAWLVNSHGVSAAGAAVTAGSAAREQDQPLSVRLQSLLDGLVEREPGVRSGLLLVDGPTFHWKGASGLAFAESQTPAVPDDQFNTDSIAKMMTATIVMKLVEQERLKLDDRVAEYLPDSLMDGLHEFDGQSFSHEITVRQLLNHTSGIVDMWACPGFLDLIGGDPGRRWSPEETIGYVKEHCAPRFAPGDGWHYSDTGYNLLGLVLESVSEKPLHELYREMLLDPLGMEHTYRPAYEPHRPVIPGRLPAERYLEDTECGLWTSVMTADWAGGGLVSTGEDLNTFLRAFVRGDIFADSLTKAQMLTWVESGPHNNYGFGISRVLFPSFDDPSVRALGEVWGHGGSSHNVMYYWPQEDVTIIGTLNQMAASADVYDTVASIMKTIHLAIRPNDSTGGKPAGESW